MSTPERTTRPVTPAPLVDVTVIVPCRNGARFLEAMMDSVARQTARPSRCILADDGSTDDTAAIARAAGWTVVPTAGNAERGVGIAGARNTALVHATTAYVAFLDADDEWEPEHLADCVALLERYPEAVMAFGAMQRSDREDTVALPPSIPRRAPFHAAVRLLGNNFVPVSAVVARRAAVSAIGGFDESMRVVEDYELWLRLSHIGPFVYRDALSLRYRIHEGQISGNQLRMVETALTLLDERSRSMLATADAASRAEIIAEARNGWSTLLDALWFHGHVDAHARWLDVYARTFGSAHPTAFVRRRPVGHLLRLFRRLRTAGTG